MLIQIFAGALLLLGSWLIFHALVSLEEPAHTRPTLRVTRYAVRPEPSAHERHMPKAA